MSNEKKEQTWTSDKLETMPGYFVLRKHNTYVGVINCSSPAIEEIVMELNAYEQRVRELETSLKQLLGACPRPDDYNTKLIAAMENAHRLITTTDTKQQ